MESAHEYVMEIFNKEIGKLRQELYESYESALTQKFILADVKTAWNYFSATPVMNSLNRRSIDMIVELCEYAKRNREEREKRDGI